MTRRGFVYHDWNAYNGDSDGFGYEAQIEKAVTEAAYNDRSVMLLHSKPDQDTVIDTLYKIVPKLRDKGYRFGVLDETVKPVQFIKTESPNPEGSRLEGSENGQGASPSPGNQKSGGQSHNETQGSVPSADPEDPQT